MKENLFKKIIYFLCVIIFTIYILYRIFFTISFNLGTICLIFSILLLLVELWDCFDAYIFFFNILIPNSPKYNKPNINNISFPNVDIFIATYNEDEKIVKYTVSKCLELDYPNKNMVHIYICDDGNRKNIKELSKTLNVNYISRVNRKDFKAGNYNNAISKTSSPYIVTLDADMAPEANFLMETIPYFFSEEKVGFVQLPQSFRNPDIYQYRFNLEKEIPFEQDYFYNFINQKKSSFNAGIYCGTNAVISRKALAEVNNFSTNTLTEDLSTGMKIEANGYKGIVLDIPLVYGESVLDLEGFLKQRTRWSRGCIQILKHSNFILKKGLNIKQKLEYLSCISYWFFGIKRLIYLLAPLLFTFLNIITIDCNLKVFVALWLPSYLFRRLIIDIFSGHTHSSTWNKIYETILAPVISKEVFKELFGLKKIGFEVSPKNETLKSSYSKANIKLLCSHLTLLVLNIIGYIVCFYKFVLYSFSPIYILSLLFLLSNIFYLTVATIFDTNNRLYNVNDFKPNKVKKYSIKSIFNIFTNLTLKKNNFEVKKITGFKKVFICFSFLIFTSVCLAIPWKNIIRYGTPNLVSGSGNLYVKGSKLYNRYNEPFVLKGLSSHGLQWYSDVLTYDNLKYLRDNWGINAFRLALYTEENGYISNPSLKNKLLELTDNLIDLDMYVIIDWHILSDGDPMIHINESKDFFYEVSFKYKDCPNVIYEICNEPNNVTWEDSIKPYANEIIPIIRKNSPNSLIIVGTPNWSTYVDDIIASPLEFKNILYACHFYAGTHKTDNRNKVQKVLDNNLCVFVSEWGTTNLTGDDELSLGSSAEWIEFLDKNNISWINWSFSNKDENSAILKPVYINTSEDIDNNLTDSGKYIKSIISTK